MTQSCQNETAFWHFYAAGIQPLVPAKVADSGGNVLKSWRTDASSQRAALACFESETCRVICGADMYLNFFWHYAEIS